MESSKASSTAFLDAEHGQVSGVDDILYSTVHLAGAMLIKGPQKSNRRFFDRTASE